MTAKFCRDRGDSDWVRKDVKFASEIELNDEKEQKRERKIKTRTMKIGLERIENQ